jgi:hypothetical protein
MRLADSSRIDSTLCSHIELIHNDDLLATR